MTSFDKLTLVPACTQESHQDLRADMAAFVRATTPAGRQDIGAGYLELRRCRSCGSTLSMPGGTLPLWLYRMEGPDGKAIHAVSEEHAAELAADQGRSADAWARIYELPDGSDSDPVPLDGEERARIQTMIDQLQAAAGGGPGWADRGTRLLCGLVLAFGVVASWGWL